MVKQSVHYIVLITLITAIGGFLLGFDGSVISGAAPFYKEVFGLSDSSFLFGFSVSCIIWGSVFGNLLAGPLTDRIGRKPALLIAAILFTSSSLITAFASNVIIFIAGRIMAGLAVGIAILVAPIYIAEVSPAKHRGWLVSFNQLLIVIGLSAAYFSNYFILKIVSAPEVNWRWMLGIEAIPSALYFFLVLTIPESPRWLILKGRDNEAQNVLSKIGGAAYSKEEFQSIKHSVQINGELTLKAQSKELFSPNMRLILFIAFGLAVFQQVSGINAILYYAPMIFESAGGERSDAFFQSAVLGIVFLGMTIVSMFLIDRLGRKPLLFIGVSIMAISLLISGICFKNATYLLTDEGVRTISTGYKQSLIKKSLKERDFEKYKFSAITIEGGGIVIRNSNDQLEKLSMELFTSDQSQVKKLHSQLTGITGKEFLSEMAFEKELQPIYADADSSYDLAGTIKRKSIQINGTLVLISILCFIAGFSISLGPVMWTMFSEIFPNRVRGLAISIAGTINSLTSFTVATAFPVQLAAFGAATTYFMYSAFMFLCLAFIWRYVVETKGRSLEELEITLTGKNL